MCPTNVWVITFAPIFWQIWAVLSVEKESTTTISSAIFCTECKQRPILFSSLYVIIATDNLIMEYKYYLVSDKSLYAFARPPATDLSSLNDFSAVSISL